MAPEIRAAAYVICPLVVWLPVVYFYPEQAKDLLLYIGSYTCSGSDAVVA